MREIFTGADNLLANAQGKLFINCATVSPEVHLEVERLADAAGAASLEACMASSITQAREGSLYLMCGGREEIFRRAEPVLKELSTSLRYIGQSGEAAKVKALVNMVMNINTAGLAEGLGLGEALGLDLTMLREVFSQTGAASRVLQTDGEDMQNRDHACFFSAPMRPRTAALRFSWRGISDSIFRWRARPKHSSTPWSPKAWANSINQASPSLRSKIGTSTPAITFESVLTGSIIARRRP